MAGAVVTREANIPFDGSEIEAFIATPEPEDGFPAVVVVHEWWGLNDHIRDVANRLASEGFVTIAPDLFDGRVTTDAEVAGSMMIGLNQQEALARLGAAVRFIRLEGIEKIGVIGFCMGGSYSLMLPIHDSSVAAAVPFYGQVPGNDILDGLNSPVLYIYAGKDQWITKDEVDRLGAHLSEKGKPGEVVRYPDCDHAFFNDTRPEVYDESNAGDAWNRAVAFLKTNLG